MTGPLISADAHASELRHAASFGGQAPPNMRLEMPTKPPPLRNRQSACQQPRSLNSGNCTITKLEPIRPTVPTVETDFLIESRFDDSDPPFRTPTTWQKTERTTPVERMWQWSERSTAAFLGFAAGVLIIIPTVMYLAASSGQETMPVAIEVIQPSSETTQTADAATLPLASTPQPEPIFATAGADATSRITVGAWHDSRSSAPTDAASTSVSLSKDMASEQQQKDIATKARSALASGHLAEARDQLRQAASPDRPDLWFMLAETYDPGQLVRLPEDTEKSKRPDNLQKADIRFARYYYQQALTYGVAEAKVRLAALKED